VPFTGLQVSDSRNARAPRRPIPRQYVPDDSAQSLPSQPAASAQYNPADGANGGAEPSAADGGKSSRIDPSQIPRPEALTQPETFTTRASLGQNPPAATSSYIVQDDGNCSPRLIRLTLNQVATTDEALTQSAIPFGAIVQPLADLPPNEAQVAVVDYGETGPLRCGRCRAYINPFFTFTDRGRSFVCNMCGFVNQTPREHFCELDQHGYRRDARERPELAYGAVEFAAPADFQARPPLPPPLVLLMEATYSSVSSGLFASVIDCVRTLLPSLPSYTRLAIVTYNDSVHFYSGGEQMRQFCVADVNDVCLPLPPQALLQSLETARDHCAELLATLPALFASTKRPDAAFGAAMQACAQLLEPTGGRLLVFQHTLPGVGPLKLSQRDDVRTYGTDKEKTLFSPVDSEWGSLAQRLSSNHICAHFFHFTAHNFVDVASMSSLARSTGGQVYLYADCVPEQRDVWAAKLQAELSRCVLRTHGYEGVMRFRCSRGLRVEQYLTGSAKQGDVDVDVPGVDADSTFAVTFKHDERLEDGANACVQCALLYTTGDGQRRIRVLTLGLQATAAMSTLYRYADLDAYMNVLMRRAVLSSPKATLHQMREAVVSSCVDALYTYRRTCASNTSAGQLILPESLKLLPLYTLALIKNPLMRAGTDIRADERSALMAQACRMPLISSVDFVYPRLLGVHNLDAAAGTTDEHGVVQLPKSMPLSCEKLEAEGVYLLDDSVALYLWVGRAVPPAILEATLQVRSLEGVDCSRLRVVPLQNELSAKLNNVINAVRAQRPHLLQPLRVVTAKDSAEARFLASLIEDRAQASMSYVEFLCHIHRQIQSKFT